ncbi:MAG TPA: hypothetical protein VGP96_11110 [Candidatus Dormibacteraeota bacterium]|nr:hypothetical protein [Candidatus Dormibacteraeota bacterium]
MPRRIEVPSADALFGRPPAPAPRREPRPPAAAPSPKPAARAPRRRASAPLRVDEGVLRRLDQLEAVLGDLSVDRLIELRMELEVLLATGTVDSTELQRVLAIGGG